LAIVRDSYELFDHTADLGVRARAATVAGLIPQATMALYESIGELVAHTEVESRTLEFTGEGYAVLLRDYLARLLTIFELQECVAHKLAVEDFTETHLAVSLRLAEIEPQRTIYHREVKAVTYHDLEVREIPGGYEATFVLDI
jgi:SHS2 domain-containing protein